MRCFGYRCELSSCAFITLLYLILSLRLFNIRMGSHLLQRAEETCRRISPLPVFRMWWPFAFSTIVISCSTRRSSGTRRGIVSAEMVEHVSAEVCFILVLTSRSWTDETYSITEYILKSSIDWALKKDHAPRSLPELLSLSLFIVCPLSSFHQPSLIAICYREDNFIRQCMWPNSSFLLPLHSLMLPPPLCTTDSNLGPSRTMMLVSFPPSLSASVSNYLFFNRLCAYPQNIRPRNRNKPPEMVLPDPCSPTCPRGPARVWGILREVEVQVCLCWCRLNKGRCHLSYAQLEERKELFSMMFL
jgi:hypothetical protein